MAATAKEFPASHVPEEVRSWSDTFINGVIVDEGKEEEPEVEVDSDSDFERVAEEEITGVAARESGGKMAAAFHVRVEEQSSGCAVAARHGDGEHISEDNYVQARDGLRTRKRKATVTPGKPHTTAEQDKSAQGECLMAENEMLRKQLLRKTKELD